MRERIRVHLLGRTRPRDEENDDARGREGYIQARGKGVILGVFSFSTGYWVWVKSKCAVILAVSRNCKSRGQFLFAISALNFRVIGVSPEPESVKSLP